MAIVVVYNAKMNDTVELFVKLLRIIGGIGLLIAISTLIGWTDEVIPIKEGWRWRIVLRVILLGGVQASVAYFLAMAFVQFLRTRGHELNTLNAYLLYVWGLRVVSVLSVWRAISPRKSWAENNALPKYARLELAGIVVLTGALSFLPIA